ncbi:DNA methyltransferase [Fusobacterium sp. SYSU M8D902]|uniref:site-specific DNA-methyltransferase n=1 Tax=Fusobacterium sp. SYSU M8D902 TaxID=3159562 RepID=UPI0032E47D92
MIKSQIIKNEIVQPNTRELEKLREILPQYFDKEGSFKLDSFNEMLKSNEIKIEKEGYELKFLGKNYSKFQSGLETETVIVPDIEHNLKEENINSENMYIVGDNLDALKHLLKSYSNKIKCIYIDPPYNTGSDGFIYNDNFSFTPEVLSEKMGIDEEEANKIINLKGKSSHSAWLTFMYSRLLLAQNLLSDDGVIFISIDENEQANLKLICDEIFGEENFIETLIWKRRATPPNDRVIGKNHEYIFVIAKNYNTHKLNLQKRTLKLNKDYINRDNDPRGEWNYGDLSGNGKGGRIVESCIYPILDPLTGKEHYPPENKCWLYNREKMQEMIEDNRIVFRGEKRTPYQKKFLSEVRNGSTLPTLIEDVNYSIDIENSGTSQTSSKEIKELFGADVFEFPKPIKLLSKVIIAGCDKDSIILDFFSGSATTAHTVMEINKEDDGNRKYIMVQLPEEIKEDKIAYKEGYRTIDEIGRERIKRVGEKIKKDYPNIDCGFKLFRLKEVEQNMLDKIIEFNPETQLFYMEDYVEAFKYENISGKDTILTTWLNEDGYGLITKSKKIKLINYEIDVCNNSAYIINLGITTEDAIRLIEMIEDNKLLINRIVIYPYSIPFNIIHELRNNLKQLHKDIELIERY